MSIKTRSEGIGRDEIAMQVPGGILSILPSVAEE